MPNQDLDLLYRILKEHKDFSNNEKNAEIFLDTADKIIAQKNPDSIPVLLAYFDDEREYTWIFESLQCSLENFPIETFTKAFFENLSVFVPRAIFWAEAIMYSILNVEAGQKAAQIYCFLAPQKLLLKLFDIMDQESPHHRELIAELRTEVLKRKD